MEDSDNVLLNAADRNNIDAVPWTRGVPSARRTLPLCEQGGARNEEGNRHTSFPAAMVTILPFFAMRLATTEEAEAVHPSAPPRDKVTISCPSWLALSRASMITDTTLSELRRHRVPYGMLTFIGRGSVAAKNTVSGDRGLVGNTSDIVWIVRISSDDTLEFQKMRLNSCVVCARVLSKLTATWVPCPKRAGR